MSLIGSFVRTHAWLPVALALPVCTAAQSPSVLWLLPVDGRTLELGGEHRGALSTSDHVSIQDTYLEAWELEGRAGEEVTIDLVSSDFDAMLYLVGPGFGETLSDDDGGGGCNARLSVTLLEDGTYRVVASSLGRRESGTYTLLVSDRPTAVPGYGCGEADPSRLAELPTQDRTLAMGSVELSQMSAFAPTVEEGRPAEAWLLSGSAGEAVSIVMESDAFDAYLYVVGPGLDGAVSDDDSAGDLDAQIDLVLPADGPYTVVASSIEPGATGAYTIRVTEPVDLGALPTDGRRIEPGQTVEGRLGFEDPIVVDGRKGQAWALQGEAGQEVTIDLVSEDFDTYLYLAGPGLVVPLENDDFGGELHSRISTTLPETGVYRIIVSALDPDSTGAFTLRVGS